MLWTLRKKSRTKCVNSADIQTNKRSCVCDKLLNVQFFLFLPESVKNFYKNALSAQKLKNLPEGLQKKISKEAALPRKKIRSTTSAGERLPRRCSFSLPG